MSTATKAVDPKAFTIKGRLSFPRFTMAEAIAGNATSSYPKKDDKINTDFNLLIEQAQLDKLIEHIETVFIPYAEEQHKKNEKRDALDPKAVKKIRDWIAAGDLTEAPPQMLIKALSEKNAEAAPECVASIKVNGPVGNDVTLKASVFDESQLAVPDPDRVTYPVMLPINETVFSFYAGAYVAATLNLYAFFSSNAIFGISAGANTAVYMGNLDGERFGGGASIDEDAIFMD